MKIGFIGLGKYGSAIAQAILERGEIAADDMIVHDLDFSKAASFEEQGCEVAGDWDAIIESADVIIYGLPSTSHLAYERARDLAVRLEEAKKPCLLVRMDTLVHPVCHGEPKSRVSLIRIMFGLSIKSGTAPIAVLRIDKESADPSRDLIDPFLKILRRVGHVYPAKDCHDLLLFRFLAGTMMFPVAQALEGQDGYSEDIAKSIFEHMLDNADDASRAYDSVKESTKALLTTSGKTAQLLLQEIGSPGGLTEFLRPALSAWPSDRSTLADFVGRIKAMICDYERRLIGVSLVASARMAEQDLYQYPLAGSGIDASVQDATRRLCDYLGVYCYFWPRVFSYVSLVNGVAHQVKVERKESDNNWFRDVINYWFVRDYSKSKILVSPQRFLRDLPGYTGYAQVALIHGMVPSDLPEYVAPEGMKDRDLGALLDVHIECLAKDPDVKETMDKIRSGGITAGQFVSWVESFSPPKTMEDTFRTNFHHYESTLDGVIRYCIWVMGASARPQGTWGNIFIPFSHRDTLPVSLHVGIYRWLGAEYSSCLQSILSACFMPVLEQDNREKAAHAAAAAILSRNMSHHIGSHVMPRATVKDVEKRLAQLYMVPDEPPREAPEVFPSIERLKTAFDDFIQKKADFLAEVTTDPCSSSDSKLLGRDILAPLMRNALLMDNIARNEGYGYDLFPVSELTDGQRKRLRAEPNKSLRRKMEVEMRMRSTLKISLCVRSDGGCLRILGPDLPPYDPSFWPFDSRNREPAFFGVVPTCADRDPMIAVPGVVGQYALYGILDNIIRNAAKHDTAKEDANSSNLHIQLHVEDDSDAPDDYYRLSIWDNRADPVNETFTWHDEQKGDRNNLRLDEYLQCWADAELIDRTGAVRRNAWGVAEIVICANLLAGRRRYDNRARDNDPEAKVVRVFCGHSPHVEGKALSCSGRDVSHEECQGQRLIHQLRLLKAKRGAFVGRAFAEAWAGHDVALRKKGIYTFTDPEALKRFLNRSESRQAFQFAVFDGDSVPTSVLAYENDANAALLAALPFRVFWVTAKGTEVPSEARKSVVVSMPLERLADLMQSPTADALMERLWQNWIERNQRLNPDGKTVTALVYLDIGAKEQIFKDWATAARNLNNKKGPVRVCPQSSGDERGENESSSDATIRAAFVRHKDTLGHLGTNDMFESFGKRSADCDMLLNAVLPSREQPYWELPYVMAEAGLLRILLIDERMTERAIAPYDGDSRIRERLLGDSLRSPCFWHLAQRAKVYIATHLQVGDRQDSMGALHKSYNEAKTLRENAKTGDSRAACPSLQIKITEKGGLEAVLYDPDGSGSPHDVPEFDIVVIHQGVIDSFCPKNEKGESGITEEKMRKWIMTTHPWLVVESGRGIPPGLQKKPIRFLSFSVLDQAMTADGIGKLLLTRRLMALPRFVDNGNES